MGAIAVLAIMYLILVWLPLSENIERMHKQVEQQSQDLLWMQQRAAEVRQLYKMSAEKKVTSRNLPLLTQIDSTATKLKLRNRIKQIQPGKDDSTAKVWFDKVLFESWLRWLDSISKNGIAVESVSVSRSSVHPRVNIHMELRQ